jgi:hypothetical protein
VLKSDHLAALLGENSQRFTARPALRERRLKQASQLTGSGAGAAGLARLPRLG